MVKQVACVLKIFDSSTNTALRPTQVGLFLDGSAIKPIYKNGGYFVLIDIPEGEHTLQITSAIFQPQEQLINVDYSRRFDENMDVMPVMLNPSAQHPGAVRGHVLRGSFSTAEQVSFYVANGNTCLKLAEDNAEKSRQTVKLFAGGARVVLPSLFHINDKTEKNREFVMINSARGDEYILAAPLKNAHKRSTEFIPMVRYHSADDGSFFAVLPAGSCVDGEVTLLIEKGGKLISKAVAVTGMGINDVGTIKL